MISTLRGQNNESNSHNKQTPLRRSREVIQEIKRQHRELDLDLELDKD